GGGGSRGAVRSAPAAPAARAGCGRQVARLRLAPGPPRSCPSLARSLLHRSLATAPGARTLGCAWLRRRLDPRRRSLAHCCTARSRRLRAPGRSAAPRSGGASILAVARSLTVAPLAVSPSNPPAQREPPGAEERHAQG